MTASSETPQARLDRHTRPTPSVRIARAGTTVTCRGDPGHLDGDVHLGLQETSELSTARARTVRVADRRVPDELEPSGKPRLGHAAERTTGRLRSGREIPFRDVQPHPEPAWVRHDGGRRGGVRAGRVPRVRVALDDDAGQGRREPEDLVGTVCGLEKRGGISAPARQPGRRAGVLRPGAREIRVGGVDLLARNGAALVKAPGPVVVPLRGGEVRLGAGRVGLRLAVVGRGDLREEGAGGNARADRGGERDDAAGDRREHVHGRVLVPGEAARHGDRRRHLVRGRLEGEGRELGRRALEDDQVALHPGSGNVGGRGRETAATPERGRDEDGENGSFITSTEGAARRAAW